MNDVRTPSDPGQNTHPSSPSSHDPSELLAELLAFRRDFESALPRLQVALERIEAKLRASGFDVADIAEPPPLPPPPPFALLTDGRVLLSTSAFGGRDLGEREVWTGVVLSPSDVTFVLGRADNAAHETACHLVTQYPRESRPPSGDNDGEENESESEDSEEGDAE